MYSLFLTLVWFLVHINALPSPEPQPPSFFNIPSLKPLDDFGLDLFNLSGWAKASHSASRDIKKRATLPAILFDVVFNGVDQDNPLDFVASGQILLTGTVPTYPTINGVNPLDAAIIIGPTPALGAQPMTGNLRYTTNRALQKLIGGATPILYNPYDFAWVTQSGTTMSAVVDTSIAPLNDYAFFSVGNNILSPVFHITYGSFVIAIATDNTVTGKVNFNGDSYVPAGRAQYNAIISGRALGSFNVVI